jgi:hypothetical protein
VPVVEPVVHKYVSVPVPPVAVTVTDPLLWLHVAGCAVTLELMAEGCVITCVILAWHKFASVTVSVYVPTPKVVTFWVVLPLLHKYCTGDKPPVTVTLIVPLLPPLQLTFTAVTLLITGPV